MNADGPGQNRPGKTAQGRSAHFLERAVHADTRTAAAGDAESRRSWSDMAALYRQLAALAAHERSFL